MVAGLERFRDFFREDKDQYVLIGGVAAMRWLSEAGLNPRATKDLDIVLILESRRQEFQRRFWEFVRNGGYRNCYQSAGRRRHYRFSFPVEDDYPRMLEIFSRMPDGLEMRGEPVIVPIAGDGEVSSLSAILMDDGYYEIVRGNVRVANDLPLLSPEGLILLKARAWLDLVGRKDQSQHVDARDVRKHRTDVFKLCLLLVPEETIHIPRNVQDDLLEFLDHFPPDSPEWTSIRQASGMENRMPKPSELLGILKQHFAPAD